MKLKVTFDVKAARLAGETKTATELVTRAGFSWAFEVPRGEDFVVFHGCQNKYLNGFEFMKVEPDRAIFPRHAAGLSLSHNEHKTVHLTALQWIEEREAFQEGGEAINWVDPTQRQKAIDTDSVWLLHWYPDTSGSLRELAAADLDVLLAAAAD